MRAAAYYGDIFLEHKPPTVHYESPERLERAIASLRKYGLWEDLKIVEPPPPDEKLALVVHEESYVKLVKKLSNRGYGWLDSDTYISPGTWGSALSALSSVKNAVEMLLDKGFSKPIIVLARPPAHHAGSSGAAMGAPTLGFCIFNHAALAAKLIADKGLRVCVLDFDLHHGNGTQEIVYEDPRILHIDIHQDPSTIYPGTGFTHQIGSGRARGTKINIPLAPGSGDDVYEKALEFALEVASNKRVEALIFDMGFDAYLGDGLAASMNLTSNTYHVIATRTIDELKPRILMAILEGGYTIGLERGLPAFISGLLNLGDPVSDKRTASPPSKFAFLNRSVNYLKTILVGS